MKPSFQKHIPKAYLAICLVFIAVIWEEYFRGQIHPAFAWLLTGFAIFLFIIVLVNIQRKDNS